MNPHIVTCAGLAGDASGTGTGGEADYLLDISDTALLELLDEVQLKGGSPDHSCDPVYILPHGSRDG